MLNNLKILTFSYIAEHDRLTKDEKLQLGEFVKEANKDQVLNLLITGYPQSESISEKFVKENKEVISELDKAVRMVRAGDHFIFHTTRQSIEGGITSIGLTVFFILLMTAGTKLYMDYVDKVGKKCRDYTGSAKWWCMYKVKAQGLEKEIKALKNSTKECKKTNDPIKCAKKINEKIMKLTLKMKKYIAKSNELKNDMVKKPFGDK
jgi:hypothetical protein